MDPGETVKHDLGTRPCQPGRHRYPGNEGAVRAGEAAGSIGASSVRAALAQSGANPSTQSQPGQAHTFHHLSIIHEVLVPLEHDLEDAIGERLGADPLHSVCVGRPPDTSHAGCDITRYRSATADVRLRRPPHLPTSPVTARYAHGPAHVHTSRWCHSRRLQYLIGSSIMRGHA